MIVAFMSSLKHTDADTHKDCQQQSTSSTGVAEFVSGSKVATDRVGELCLLLWIRLNNGPEQGTETNGWHGPGNAHSSGRHLGEEVHLKLSVQ